MTSSSRGRSYKYRSSDGRINNQEINKGSSYV